MRTLNNQDIVISPGDRPGGFSAKKPRARATQPKASKLKARKAKKGFRGPLLTPVQKFSILGVLSVALIMSCVVIWHSGWPQRMIRNSYDTALDTTAILGFRVDDISVTGRSRTAADDILIALGVGRNDPIMGVDLEDVKARLEEIPSVQNATVERRLPNTLHVALVERRPVALWQNQGNFMLVDKNGRQFPGSVDGFQDLPLIVGDGAPIASAELFALLSTEASLAPRVKAAIRVSNRRWNLRLDDAQHGLEVRLPEGDLKTALHQLADLEKNHSLTNRHVEMVDLRISDRMVVKTTPEQAATAPPPHKEGG